MDFADLHDALTTALRPIAADIVSPWFYLQGGVILAAIAIAAAIEALVRRRVDVAGPSDWPSSLRRLVRVLVLSTGTLVFAVLVFAARAAMKEWAPPHHTYLLAVGGSLAVAWLIIRFVASLIRNDTIVRLVSISAWTVAALSILGWLPPVIDALDSVAIVLGGIRVTPLLVIKATVFLAVALWIAGLVSRFLESRIESSRDLTPSLQVLLAKIVHLAVMVIAVIVVMAGVGIDVSSLAILSGAIGVGLGLGLQKIVSNFISGIILLSDKSVKPGDLITIGDNTGVVNAMRTRYTSVSAGDGREYLIPNEDLVTQKVVNWTYTDRSALVKVAFATGYDADPRATCKLACEIAAAVPQVMRAKPPTCLLSEFTDAGIRFSLTCWVADLGVGTDNIKSEVMARLWEAFRDHGIGAPVPTRDVRLTDARAAASRPTPEADA